ncbi:N utilization substance protein B [Candidatus Gastranaerophilus sp. (ex Termes propinquus)]|nr:N utilization substance protein B [Candidatus Gastranaerophilus sp. (ex Termes propinquus)]
MQARRASRELALILFSQMDKDVKIHGVNDFENIVLKSVRTLTGNAQEELSTASSELVKIKEFVEEYENNHPENLERPFDVSNIPVKIPMTSDMAGRLEMLLSVCEKAAAALEIAELAALSQKNDVSEYVQLIANTFKDKSTEIDAIIKELAFGWDIDRLFKIDKNILRIAIAELVFVKDAPVKVVIDEALELAKKYSTDESSSFINGILAKVVELYVKPGQAAKGK